MNYSAPVEWLLDPANPSCRLHALREVFDRPESDPEVQQARTALLASQPVVSAFAARSEDGSWGDLSGADAPRGTAWMLSWLLLLGVPARDARMIQGARALIASRQMRDRPALRDWPGGAYGVSKHAGDVASCVTGDNLALALSILGPLEENRLAVLWLLRHQRHDGGWLHCHRWSWRARSRGVLPSRWKLSWPEESDPSVRSCRFGTFRAMRALATLPEELRDEHVRRAITRGAEFFLARGVTGSEENPGTDVIPKAKAFNAGFALLGTPVRQTLDMLAVARLLTDLGYGADPRLSQTATRIRHLQEKDGRWRCESNGPGMWPGDEPSADAGAKRVTIAAIALLRRVARSHGLEMSLG